MKIITFIILGIIVLIFFTQINFYDTKSDLVNYHLRTFYHANMTHLLVNAFSLYNLSFIEEVIGQKKFLFAIIFIWIVSSILLYTIHKILPSRKVYTVGFSAVIFGLVVVYFSLLNQSAHITLFRLLVSILPQLLIPGISFEGHLSGIIAGFLFVTFFPVNKGK